MNEKMTLRELRQMLAPVPKGRMPGKEILKQQGEMVADYQSGDFHISIFLPGYALAESGRRWTVFKVAEYGVYEYEMDDSFLVDEAGIDHRFEMEFFLDQPWTVRLTMAAEDRLESNNDESQRRLIAEHPEIPWKEEWLFGVSESAEAEFMREECKRERLECLTEKQRQAVELWLEGYTQMEIGEMLSVSRDGIKDRLHGAFVKMGKTYSK